MGFLSGGDDFVSRDLAPNQNREYEKIEIKLQLKIDGKGYTQTDTCLTVRTSLFYLYYNTFTHICVVFKSVLDSPSRKV